MVTLGFDLKSIKIVTDFDKRSNEGCLYFILEVVNSNFYIDNIPNKNAKSNMTWLHVSV